MKNRLNLLLCLLALTIFMVCVVFLLSYSNQAAETADCSANRTVVMKANGFPCGMTMSFNMSSATVTLQIQRNSGLISLRRNSITPSIQGEAMWNLQNIWEVGRQKPEY